MSTHLNEALPRVRLRTARDVVHTQREYVWNAKGLSAESNLSTADLVVLNKLVMHADGDGRTTVRAARIARDTKLGERTVRGSLSKLRREGLVISSTLPTRTGRANVYFVQRDRRNACTRVDSKAMELDPPTPASERSETTPDDVLDSVSLSVQETIAPPSSDIEGSGTTCSTDPAVDAGSPPGPLSSERIQINVPPLSPPEGGVEISDTTGRAGETFGSSPSEPDVVTRVLAFFIATLWPKNVGPCMDRLRRRLVLARLRELQGSMSPEEAEQVLRDAVLGAQLDPWHRAEPHRQQARFVFRNLDKVEELATLARTKRRSTLRSQAPTPDIPPRSVLSDGKPLPIPESALDGAAAWLRQIIQPVR